MPKPEPVDNTRKTYFATRSIKHGVKGEPDTYEAGDAIELTAKEAAELLALGAIEAPRAPKDEKAEAAK